MSNITKADLLHEARMNGLYDGWSVSMCWLFAISDYIATDLEDWPPAKWEFHQSPFGADTDSYEYQTLQELKPSRDVLDSFGAVMWRYSRLLKVAGKDY